MECSSMEICRKISNRCTSLPERWTNIVITIIFLAKPYNDDISPNLDYKSKSACKIGFCGHRIWSFWRVNALDVLASNLCSLIWLLQLCTMTQYLDTITKIWRISVIDDHKSLINHRVIGVYLSLFEFLITEVPNRIRGLGDRHKVWPKQHCFIALQIWGIQKTYHLNVTRPSQ